MKLQELRFKTRKYWLWSNLIATIFVVALMLVFEQYGVSEELAFLVYVLLAFLGFGTDMVITKQEVVKISIFFLTLLYVVVAWFRFDKSQNAFEFVSVETLTNFAYLSAFFLIPIFVFGYIPYKILHWKDKNIINTGVYRFKDAAYFVYRQLPDKIAQKTSLEEMEAILKILFGSKYAQLPESFVAEKVELQGRVGAVLKAYPQFSKAEVDEILTLNKQYIAEN